MTHHPEPKGFTVWFTGLSGAGKSTIAEMLYHEFQARQMKTEILDGDVVRQNLSKGLGFSKEDRDENIRRIGYVADLLSRNGVIVLAAAISPYRAVRDELRALIGDFVEVWVATDLATCRARDVKGLYARHARGELRGLTGVDDPYEPPLAPELVLDTAVEQSLVEKSGTWYTYKNERIGQGRENAKKWLQDNPVVLADLEAKIREALGLRAPVAVK